MKQQVLNVLRVWGPMLLNLVLFGIFGVDAVKRLQKANGAGALDFVEVSFAVQTGVMICMILFRRNHKAVDPSFWNQGVALCAVFSGLLLADLPPSGDLMIVLSAKGLVLTANVLGILTLLNLGRSFGFLIAVREVRTTGLYGVVRHPMYATDILLRIGYLLANMSLQNGVVFLFSCSAYVYRAILEERFLRKTPEYQEFMDRVKYRFIPYVV